MNWNQLLCEERISIFDSQRKKKSANTSAQGSPFSDVRSEFLRDHDRIVFSTPFRRLQDKAQVFPLEPNDSVRTRLTHSIEVSCVARGLGSAVAAQLASKNSITAKQQEDIPVICQSAGLIHDLGNPPFGHAGEAAISSWFRCRDSFHTDFLNFEGNAQTLRILSKLQVIGKEKLNPTLSLFNVVMKYLASSKSFNNASHTMSKPGYFDSEFELVKKVQKQLGTTGVRHPLTFLVEAADDICYSIVDLEDGVRKKVISFDQVVECLKKYDTSKLYLEVLVDAQNYLGVKSVSKADQDHMVQAFRIFAIKVVIPYIVESFISNYSDIMSGKFENELYGVSGAKSFLDACKRIGRERVYCAPDILKLELTGRQVIHGLMDTFWEGACAYVGKGPKAKDFEGKAFLLISENYRSIFEQAWKDNLHDQKYIRAQLVTDYMSGMTDSFAINLHRQLGSP